MKRPSLRACHLAAVLLIPLSSPSALGADQSFLVHSDTQYRWYDDDKNPDPEPTLLAQTNAIAAWLTRQAPGTPVFLNGDATAFGHGDEWKFMLKDLDNPAVPNRYWGLGNHDYDNNIGDCANNGCARDSITHLDEATKKWGLDAFDYRTEDHGLFRTHVGSLAYSKTIGAIKFIQMHNHYLYTVEFESSVFPRTYKFKITPSLDWLEKELKNAKAASKFVVLNMHRPPMSFGDEGARKRFAKLVEDHRVLAIFHGHTHNVGVSTPIGETAVLNSGASFRKTFLTADLDLGANQLRVYKATDNTVSDQPLKTITVKQVFAPEVLLSPMPNGDPAVTFDFGQTPRDLPVGWIKVKLSGESAAREGRPGERMGGLEPARVYEYTLTAHSSQHGAALKSFAGRFTSAKINYGPTNLCVLAWDVDAQVLTLQWDLPRTLPGTFWSFVEGNAANPGGKSYLFRGPNDSNHNSRQQTIAYKRRYDIDDPMQLNYRVYYASSSQGNTPAAELLGKDLFHSGCPAE